MNFEQLLKIETIEKFDQNKQIDIIGNLFDLSFDNNSIAGIEHAFILASQIKMEELTETNFTVYHYDLSNGWSYLRKIKYAETSESWQFQMKELTKEILHLRTAASSKGFENVEKERQCQIYTNLGNSFSFIGRFVEAQEYWNRAIDIIPEFAMAIGNKGYALVSYGRVLFDNIHYNLFHVCAYHYLRQALQLSEYLHTDAHKGFKSAHDWLENYISSNFPVHYLEDFPELDDFDLGSDKELKDYRLWCLKNKLFINPLNDLGPHSVASHDCLNLPTVTLPANRPPVCLNLYNQIKQEFGTARYAYYLSVSEGAPHFSDVDVPLIETMETVRYSYYVEQLKISFRMAYSILDKIAYLLNDYLELGIAIHDVSFRKLWYSNLKRMELRTFFDNNDNWALRGLYWLSRDLYEREEDFDAVLEPEAKEMALIRNFIEHKGFKVLSGHQYWPDRFTEDDISHSISRNDFERKTLKLLKLTRAAIIYVAIAVSHEENKKDFNGLKSYSLPQSAVPNYMRT